MAAARLADAWSAARRTFSGARAQASRIGDSLRPERTNSEPHMTQVGSKSSNEPTMEDILASIRRIIAEDYSAQAAQQGQPAPQPVPAQPSRPVMPQASTDILDLNSRGERFQPPMPEVVPVPPPQQAPAMPRASMPSMQHVAPAPQPAAQAQSATQGFAARAVSEFSERLGRSFAAAERYQRETQPVQLAPEPAAESQVAPVLAREPISQSAVDAVAAAVQSHLAEAQAAQIGNTALQTQRLPEPPRPVEPAKAMAEPAPRPALAQQIAQAQSQTAQRPVLAQPKLAEPRVSLTQPAPVQSAAHAPAPVSSAPAPVAQAASQPRAAEPIMQNDPPPAWLVSPKTGSSVSGSFKALQEKQAFAPVTLTETQSAALQELVAAALRPMLKDWLDAHLPGMVERMITAEIQRVTRGE